jgi:hypothetical protein
MQRSIMLRFVNEACDELYAQSDMVGCLVEQCFKINGDQTVSLPSYIGQVRAVREFNSHIPWNLHQMRPRYNVSNWDDMWRNYRIKSKQALMRTISNEAPVTVVCDKVESPAVTVRISGATSTAQRIVEELVMDSTNKTTASAFIDIDSIVKTAVTQCDYIINDIDGLQLSAIANNELEARYVIIDVSQLPWLNQNQSQQDHYVEILYKKVLPWMQEDGDEFPAKGYDNIIVNKSMQLWCEEQGKADEAIAYDSKATRSLARKHEEENRPMQDSVALIPNPHDSLLTKIRHGDKWRFRGYTYLQGPR